MRKATHSSLLAAVVLAVATDARAQSAGSLTGRVEDTSATTNVRPAGDTRQLGTFFGEVNAARDPRIIQLGVKLYF